MSVLSNHQLKLYSVFTVIIFIGHLSANPVQEPCTKGLRVHLTVAPLVNDTMPRQLMVHWRGATPSPGDWLGVFTSSPLSISPPPQALASLEVTECEGALLTDVHEENGRVNSSEELGFISRCLGYHVAYMNSSGGVVASSCLRLEPTWMGEIPDLGVHPLTDIFLPGTHDSGSWGEIDPELGETLVIKYTVTQDEDILSQLIHGVRYLDIRVGYYPSIKDNTSSGFWLNHGVFRMHPLEEAVSQVRTFLDNTQDEVVVFDIQEFPAGFTSIDVHRKLVDFLADQFREYFIPRDTAKAGWSTTLAELRTSKARLIVSYDETSVLVMYPWLWEHVSHKWGNVRTLDLLYNYLEGVVQDPPRNRPWCAMAELTPTTWDVITDALGGLRIMAYSVNSNVTQWYQGSWGRTANAVAMDFFRGSDIVRTAIDWNERRVMKTGGRCFDSWEYK